MGKVFIEESTLTAIGDAIREKNGKSDLIPTSNMPYEIKRIQSGGSSPVSMKDVNFYDYDGTVVASYTLEEAQALTELPDAPTHEGLVFQGWNWSLPDINALTSPMDIGAMYITDDGKTRLYINIEDLSRSDVPLYISQTVDNGVSIDWGDGSETETISGTGKVNITHKYEEAGDYVISLTPIDGCILGLGHSTFNNGIMGKTTKSGSIYSNYITSVNIGSAVTMIDGYAFKDCLSLKSVTIPKEVTSTGQYVFTHCYSLKSVTIPKEVTSIGANTFSTCVSLVSISLPKSATTLATFPGCSSLKRLTIPEGITSTSFGDYVFKDCLSLVSINMPESLTVIDYCAFSGCYSLSSINIPKEVTNIKTSAFNNCQSLLRITIPKEVTSIRESAFGGCSCMMEYHLKPTIPPTLSSINAFNGIPSDCIIYVPQGCLEAYQTATNWATYADYMMEEMA